MDRKLQFIQSNSNINIREFTGPVCEMRGGVWRLTPAFRTFIEQLIVASKGRSAKVRIEFLIDKDIIVSLTDL